MARRLDDITSFDPAESYEFTNNEIDGNCYRRLVAPDPDDARRLVGDVAAAWDAAPDGSRFTFHLRPDVTFATGRPVTADDAAFSLARVVRLDRAPGFIIRQFGWTADNVDRLIRAEDARTLVLDVPRPAAAGYVLHCLSANAGSIVDRDTVRAHAVGDDLGRGWLARHTAGAGPYRLTAFEASDHVTLERNPHAAGPARMARIVLRHVPDPSAQRLLLARGDVDIARDLTADQLAGLAGDPRFSLVSAAQATSLYVAMNQAHALLRAPDMIAALKWAIDYDGIAAWLTPRTWDVCQSFLPSCLPGAIGDRPYHHDPDRARALLARVGVARGTPVTLDFATAAPSADIAQVIQANLAAIGLAVTLIPGDQRQVITRTRQRRHQLALMGWGADYFDPNSNAQAFCENPDDGEDGPLKIVAWRSHYRDPALDAASRAAGRETDEARRLADYAALQRRFMATAPFVMLLQQNAVAALGPGVAGLRLGALPDFTRYGTITRH
ncbi:ABC transporter substrate-binding protein [Acidisphaera rubrifaciens]|uniref:ABC transporter substrate-binding protein n=1 Tax=Acidisphaera rubrifaciens TaxID=50715 RepID=UPI00130E95C6|nr:ABC transporter substrate-binding protein [Acidisphaera rubrifaciens]